ncbi:MAG: hypothetical protein QG640_598 [Patescibacteria group bacterium]|nr:hypothetical protein [Patescibacteria group bacterium]
MKLVTIAQVVDIVNGVAVFVLSVALLWIAANIVRFYAAGNYYDKDRGGGGILKGCITLYATLVIWGIFTLIKQYFL